MQAKSSGILSAETASEQTTYGKNCEFAKITAEAKQEQEADLLYQQIKTNASKSNANNTTK